jgi:hypothetical protein
VFLVRSPVAYHSAGSRSGTATLKFYEGRDNLKAGRERYEQIRRLARSASESFDASGARQRLEALAAQLDNYSSGSSSRRTPPE